jgi:hemoglobin
MTISLYDRLGGTEGLEAIAKDLVANHLANSQISSRYTSDPKDIANGVATFFIQGTGGPAVYKGDDMPTVHRSMNINNDEFMAVLDDAMAALDSNGIGQREKEEVLFVLYSMKSDIVGL